MDLDFGTIKEAIDRIAELIKEFTKMLKEFVASWKKVPAAAVDDIEVPSI